MMYGYAGYGPGPDFFVFHVIGWVFWIVVIIFVIKAIRGRVWRNNWIEHDRAMEILKERYAKGEINKEEFEEKKKTLMG
jgi:putative membrane protein